MIVVCFLCLIVSVFSADVPRPKLAHLASGDVEISLDGTPGMKVYDVKYHIKGHKHHGPFHQGADGRWYHRNNAAEYNGKDKIKYIIVGEIDGKTVVTKGKLHPQERSVVLAPPRVVRACQTVFRDDFNGAFDPSHWNYEVSMYGGHNREVQAYVPDARNIFTRNGHLFIKPTLTTDHPNFSESTLSNGVMDLKALYGYCTNSDHWGCYRSGKDGLLPPVMSGKLKSKSTIKFGEVTVVARVPRGDWIWPAIWMLPKYSHYGSWPRSGEIDIMESRGNTQATDSHGHNHGVNEVGATMHWGPDASHNRFSLTHGKADGDWSHGLHTYHLTWSVNQIRVTDDHREMVNIPIHESFWQKGGFSGSNIWGAGTKAAPFDHSFYLILNVAIAGTNGFFPDGWTYNSHKPWRNDSPDVKGSFWHGRNSWLGSWHGDDVAMEIDYVEMKQC
ncbi:beta-1,3-glucan-binding protein-like [Ruditapes philippinarum]|uniref:beta-1,3-glucan-binding protein-like n=1 Tax=Ruditapes philippinarum TaxID=129788 RepID=UPI00295BD52F|nr:beta-1,3-glucan-binding protein-like [Ruditapes philippinarum]